MVAAIAGLAASALAQTATKPPHRPPVAKATKVAARGPAHPTLRAAAHAKPRPAVHHPVFVPPPPVIELDEMAVNPDLPTVLDGETRDRYRRIFQDQAAGRWGEADAEIARLSDKTLMGYVGAQRLLSPHYAARYEQLAAWLQDYNDHPDAPSIYRLALARRPRGASGELTPSTFVNQVQSSPAFAAARTVTGSDAAEAAQLRARLQQMIDDGGFNAAFALLDRRSSVDLLGPQEIELWRGRIRTHALEADSQRSLQVPVEISLPPDANWNAGLAAFTAGDMPEAARRFEMVADAPPDQASSWTLSAGAFWAARANLLAGSPQKFAPYLKRAALHNRTFYGLIAQKTLGMKIVPDWNLPAIDRKAASLLRNDRVGHRALALLQLGASTAASRELFAASLDADPGYITAILSLANKAVLPDLSVRVANAAWDARHKIQGYDGAAYPLPPWQPASGFSLDRALIWGFMRQESAFNPKARSYVGAMGLLQLMPRTAQIVRAKYAPEAAGGDPFDPSINMSLGQAYITSLLGDVDDNLVRTAAAYNGGPGNVSRWDNSLNASSDPLLYVASIPLNETRDFVQRVLANYWMYQIRLGQPTPSLDQVAAHEWPRYTSQDSGR
ncbi:MAG: transglycosylase SLT domain-containing protein [Proteobacteria bacterium]|nr:transglycosylase SLT domain-containing protein [Pseudomonadota bacterium]